LPLLFAIKQVREEDLADGALLLVRQRLRRGTDLPHVHFSSGHARHVVELADTEPGRDDPPSIGVDRCLHSCLERTLFDPPPDLPRAAVVALGRSGNVDPFLFGHRSSSSSRRHPEQDSTTVTTPNTSM